MLALTAETTSAVFETLRAAEWLPARRNELEDEVGARQGARELCDCDRLSRAL